MPANFFPTPKVQIGIAYEPSHFVRRDRDGSYGAKMPEMTADGSLIQAALLEPASVRRHRLGRAAFAGLAAFLFLAAMMVD